MHKSNDRLLLKNDEDTSKQHGEFSADVLVGWSYEQHSNSIITYYRRFRLIPRILGFIDENSRLKERIALMHLARQETDMLHSRHLIRTAM